MKWDTGPEEEMPTWARVLIIAGLCLYFGALLGVWVGTAIIQRGEFP